MTIDRITEGYGLLTLATALAGCVQDTPATVSDEAPSLTGEPAAVAAVQAVVAPKGVMVGAMPASHSKALQRFCSGGADGLALRGAMTDTETIACKDMGGNWSAVVVAGNAVYLGSGLRPRIDAFVR